MVQVYAALFSLALTHKLVVRAFGNPGDFRKKPLLLPPTHSFKHVPCTRDRVRVALFGKCYPLQKFPAHHGEHLPSFGVEGAKTRCNRVKSLNNNDFNLSSLVLRKSSLLAARGCVGHRCYILLD